MRKYYVDNIRWMIILLLVPYHAAMAWNVWGEPNYIYFEGNKIISSIVVFFSPYFMPPMTYIADKFNYGYQGSLFQHYAVFFTRFTDLTGADGGFSVGQFWFILYLFLISLIAVAIISLQRKTMHQKDIHAPLLLIFLWGLPLPLLNELLSIGGKSLAEFTYVFLVGYYMFYRCFLHMGQHCFVVRFVAEYLSSKRSYDFLSSLESWYLMISSGLHSRT